MIKIKDKGTQLIEGDLFIFILTLARGVWCALV